MLACRVWQVYADQPAETKIWMIAIACCKLAIGRSDPVLIDFLYNFDLTIPSNWHETEGSVGE